MHEQRQREKKTGEREKARNKEMWMHFTNKKSQKVRGLSFKRRDMYACIAIYTELKF